MSSLGVRMCACVCSCVCACACTGVVKTQAEFAAFVFCFVLNLLLLTVSLCQGVLQKEADSWGVCLGTNQPLVISVVRLLLGPTGCECLGKEESFK